MANLEQQLKSLLKKPGVYLFQDAKGKILYVGKAKLLASRVRSYFRPSAGLDKFKQQMVPKIARLETIATDTETEALVLEANLIRQHQPPYNVLLRDDKYYLFIKITTNEEVPRVFPVRKIKRDGARYFGPYSSARSVRATLRLLRRLFPHRVEKESPREQVFPHPLFTNHPSASLRSAPPLLKGRKVKSLSPPYEGGVPERSEGEGVYNHNIQNIIRFLSGRRDEIVATLRAGMQEASEQKNFEQAAIFRDQLQAIERLEGNQKVFLPRKESFDVISLAGTTGKSSANVFQIRGGKLLGKQTFLLSHRSAANPADVLRQFLLQYYRVAQDIPSLALIPLKLADQPALSKFLSLELAVPRRGHKKQLLAMGELNAQQLIREEEASFQASTRLKQAVVELFMAVGASPAKTAGNPPRWRIETYDVSNIQGSLATSSMVVFENGQPRPDQYRKFRIKLGNQPNDFAMLQETLQRRFSGRHKDPPGRQAGWPLPDLVVIDGGKGQLSSAKKILDELAINVPVISIAKKDEIIFFYPVYPERSQGMLVEKPSHTQELHLSDDSDALYLIQRMRDEAHRFTISYHRLLRSKKQKRSLLDEIPGIGPKNKKRLLSRFGSLKNIRAATSEELAVIVGPKQSKIIQDYL